MEAAERLDYCRLHGRGGGGRGGHMTSYNNAEVRLYDLSKHSFVWIIPPIRLIGKFRITAIKRLCLHLITGCSFQNLQNVSLTGYGPGGTHRLYIHNLFPPRQFLTHSI